MKPYSTRSLTRMALLTALTCILSVIALPLGPVPVTLSVLAVFLAGILLSPGQAALCMAAYLLLGCTGLPVFSGMQGGFGVLLGPTGGYLVVYPLMAATVSLLARRGRPRFLLLGMLLSLVLCHGAGTLWYAAMAALPLAEAFSVCSLPFLLPDLLKAAAALFLAQALPRGLW